MPSAAYDRGPVQLLVEVAKLVEADLNRKIIGRSRIWVMEELGSIPIAPPQITRAKKTDGEFLI